MHADIAFSERAAGKVKRLIEDETLDWVDSTAAADQKRESNRPSRASRVWAPNVGEIYSDTLGVSVV